VTIFESARPLSLGEAADDTGAFLGQGSTVRLGSPICVVVCSHDRPAISAAFLIASRDFPNSDGANPCPVASSIYVRLPGLSSQKFHLGVDFELCDAPPAVSISNVIDTHELQTYVGAN
jgi:hypothetical protein